MKSQSTMVAERKEHVFKELAVEDPEQQPMEIESYCVNCGENVSFKSNYFLLVHSSLGLHIFSIFVGRKKKPWILGVEIDFFNHFAKSLTVFVLANHGLCLLNLIYGGIKMNLNCRGRRPKCWPLDHRNNERSKYFSSVISKHWMSN